MRTSHHQNGRSFLVVQYLYPSLDNSAHVCPSRSATHARVSLTGLRELKLEPGGFFTFKNGLHNS